MKYSFVKMNALGNDYIFFNALNNPNITSNIIPHIVNLSDRNFGIGGDGVIIIEQSQFADCYMRMYNQDGSEGMMCGNGIRELAKLVWDKSWISKNPLRVETKSGILDINLQINQNNSMEKASVSMGKMEFDLNKTSFPLLSCEYINNIPSFEYYFQGNKYRFYTGAIGTEHAVCFLEDDVRKFSFQQLGKEIEQNNSLFPQGVNVEFVSIISQNQAIMRVWERGSGHTLACGTGAVFVAGLGMQLGFFSNDELIEIQLERGSLLIEKNKEELMIMHGSAEIVFEGIVELN